MSGTTIARKTNNLALVGFIIESGRGFARWAMIVGMLGVLVQIWIIIIWVSVLTKAIGNAPGLG